jgi:hypothetical protein
MAKSRASYECPLCGSSLSREDYERVLHIDEARREELNRAADELRLGQQQLERDQRRLKTEAAAAVKEAEAKSASQIAQLREELRAARAQKTKLSAEERKELLRHATDKLETQYTAKFQKLEEERERAEQRRQREAESLKRKIDELQRKAEARDRSHFGPEGEEELEALLKRQFPTDDVARRGRGGDIIHSVIDGGRACGKIVYECKRTATWQAAYVRQLKRDLEVHETRWGLLVSRVLPPRQTGFCVQDGIIVVAPQLASPMAGILRDTIVELNRASLSEDGKAAKIDELHRYLRSEEFKNAIVTIDRRIADLRQGLEREKSLHDGWWTTREQSYSAIARQSAAIDTRVRDILASVPERPIARVHRLHPSPASSA